MTKYITLAIRETNPNNFAVLALDVKQDEIRSFALKHAEIIDKSGRVFWDIGKETEVEEVSHDVCRNGNVEWHAAGRVKLGKDKTRELKQIFEKKSVRCPSFFKNNDEKFAVAKVIELVDISVEPGGEKSYMRVKIDGDKQERTLLNKDYRWVEYWKWICSKSNEELLDAKRSKYMKLFNDPSKTLYLILYRRKFPNKYWYWIAGMHWL